MKRFGVGLITGLAVSVLFINLTGCSAMRRLDRFDIAAPFIREDRSYEAKYGMIPRYEIEKLQDLADRAGKLSPEERMEKANRIADNFASQPDPLIRMEMLKTLGRLDTPEAWQTVEAGLKDPDTDVRVTACLVMGDRSADKAVPLLAGLLTGDTEVDVRLAAARALGRFQSNQQAAQTLGLALNDTDPAVQYRAMQSLASTSGRDYGNNVVAWQQYLRGETPSVAARPTWTQRWEDVWPF